MMKILLYLFLFTSMLHSQDQGDLRKGKIGVQFTQNNHASRFIFDERGGSRFLRMFWNPTRSFSLYAAVSMRGVRRNSDGDFSCIMTNASFCFSEKKDYPYPSAVSVGIDYFPFDLPVYTGLRISQEKGFSHQAVISFVESIYDLKFKSEGGLLIRSDRSDIYSFEVPLGFRWHTGTGIFFGTEFSYMRKLGADGKSRINAVWETAVQDAAMYAWIVNPDIIKRNTEAKDGVYWGIYAGMGF